MNEGLFWPKITEPAKPLEAMRALTKQPVSEVIMAGGNLTAQHTRELFIYDPITGILAWRHNVGRSGRIKAGTEAGTSNKGYRHVKIAGTNYAVHRIAWLYMTGKWPEHEIDHWDTDPGNNRFSNLRDVPNVVNKENMREAPSGKKYSPLLGAHWCKQRRRWKSSITVRGKSQYIGWFDTDVEASAAYFERKRKVHEGCTV